MMRAVAGVFLTVLTQAAFGQAGAPPSFDVASVKQAAPPTDGRIMRRMGGDAGMVNYTNVTLKMLIARAYDVKDYQVSGPEWLETEGYDVVAKLPPGTPKEQIPQMLQTLLAERFKVELHRENKTLPMYALVVAKNGPKLKEAEPDAPADGAGASGGRAAATAGSGPAYAAVGGRGKTLSGPGGPGGPGTNMNMNFGPKGRQMSGKMTMAQLANALGNLTGRPVTDLTEQKGVYEVELNWTPDDREQGGMGLGKMAAMGGPAPGGAASGDGPHAAPEAQDSGPTIFAALQEKLGLKLDPRKGPVEILVIDRAEKVPTEN
ncbi:MAG: TIGR03435 family protein [Acidobacteriia bacterium]|nr:TIGR03435 family protein [Terriglobia bacterium]